MTNDEMSFADSAAGKSCIAQAKIAHARRNRFLGDGATPWNAAHEDAAIRSGMVAHARQNVQRAALTADAAGDAVRGAAERVVIDQARKTRDQRVSSAWMR